MAKTSQPLGPQRLDRLAVSIYDLQAEFTEELINLRARVLTLEQRLEEVTDKKQRAGARRSRRS